MKKKKKNGVFALKNKNGVIKNGILPDKNQILRQHTCKWSLLQRVNSEGATGATWLVSNFYRLVSDVIWDDTQHALFQIEQVLVLSRWKAIGWAVNGVELNWYA